MDACEQPTKGYTMVLRVYVEKKFGFDVEARQLSHELRHTLGVSGLKGLRLINRYDVEGIDNELFELCIPTVFSEPQSDNVFFDLPELEADEVVFAVEFLPGQFDQRAASAAECVQLISQQEAPTVASAKVYILKGNLTDEAIQAVKNYVINPVEAREASLECHDTLALDLATPDKVEVLDGFLDL